MTLTPQGKIITFCSYRGGTGQSMATANVAWILANNGMRVLAVDWNLEAPGLHRYFYPFLVDKSLSSTDGLIDLFIDFTVAAMTPVLKNEQLPAEWYKKYAKVERYAVSLDWKFPGDGTLDFVTAGRHGSAYATRVSSFNWANFYDRFGGATFIDAVGEVMRADYDYILIDSQSGVSEISQTCIVRLADALVVCYTPNAGSIEGAATMASSATEQRRGPAQQIFPVMMRVEEAEKSLAERVKRFAKQRVAPYLPPGLDAERFCEETRFMYVPFYAFIEGLAAFTDRGRRDSILSSAERLTAYLTGGAVEEMPDVAPDDAREVLSLYEEQFDASLVAPHTSPAPLVSAPPAPAVEAPAPATSVAGEAADGKVKIFVSYSHQDQRYLSKSSLLGYIGGLEDADFWSDERIAVGTKWDEEIKSKIKQSDIALLLVSQWFINSKYIRNVEVAEFLRRMEEEGMVIFPIMISPCNWEDHEWLKTLQFIPGGGKTFVEHFNKPHNRDRFFKDVWEALVVHIASKKANRKA